MTYDIFDSNADMLSMPIISVGRNSYEALASIAEHNAKREITGYSYIALLNSEEIAFIENNKAVIDFIEYVFSKQDEPYPANEILGEDQIQRLTTKLSSADAIFLLVDFRCFESRQIIDELSQILLSNVFPNVCFTVAIIHHPSVAEGIQMEAHYRQGKHLLLKHCDCVIENPTLCESEIGLDDAMITLKHRLEQEKLAQLKSLQIFNHTLLIPGLVCIDFADVIAVVRNMGLAAVFSMTLNTDNLTDQGLQAISSELRKAEASFQREIDAVLVDICSDYLDLDTFDSIAEVICRHFNEGVRLKIGTSMGQTLPNQVIVTVLVVTRSLVDSPIALKQSNWAEQKLECLLQDNSAKKVTDLTS